MYGDLMRMLQDSSLVRVVAYPRFASLIAWIDCKVYRMTQQCLFCQERRESLDGGEMCTMCKGYLLVVFFEKGVTMRTSLDAQSSSSLYINR